jgi:flagellin-specific chaperone FliS
MSTIEVLSQVRKNLEKEKQYLEAYISSGSCETMEDYRLQVGTIRGLDKAQEIITETLSQLDKEEE